MTSATHAPGGFRVCHSPEEWQHTVASRQPARRAVLTIGTFDGLHLGHQQILTRVAERARSSEPQAVAGAITFDPHPSRLLRPEQAPRLIATLDQRLEGFRTCGLEAVLVLKFDHALSQLSPEDFVRSILVDRLCAQAVLVGENFRFGHRQAGDVRQLEGLGKRFDFVVEVVPPVTVDGEVVSSTTIRRAVHSGDVVLAARLLGRPYALTGSIESGAGRGQAMLYPTLNLAPQQELLPGTGVYATEVCLGKKSYRAATNVGYRPTVDRDGTKVHVESHLFDFHEEIAAGPMEVRFHQRLRDEIKFDSVESLRKQITQDLARAREFFTNR